MLKRLLALIVVLLLAASTAVPAFAQTVDMTKGFPGITLTPEQCALINGNPDTAAVWWAMTTPETVGCPAPS